MVFAAVEIGNGSDPVVLTLFCTLGLFLLVQVLKFWHAYRSSIKRADDFAKKIIPSEVVFDDEGIRKTCDHFDIFTKWSYYSHYYPHKNFLAILDHNGFALANIIYRKDLPENDYEALSSFVSNRLHLFNR
ncbi:hypothetical protein HUK80_06640 [Flavobacterium sp. MAH-1]|uniref:hypothetical protein n=1 Tax=Flavobacterium agri TaxID=2743471 RepID=UPI00158D1FF5|nr:hypothetical protein [Flavobacterium agri]NUY80565.1 hypothetical protein [Flavobacterium agri]